MALDPQDLPPDKVEAWRLEELLKAGYPLWLACQIAARHDLDLHDAVDLLKACTECNGDAELAARILL
jgi:hypothetical protein